MTDSFKVAIGTLILVKQEVARLDTEHLWEFFLPELAATQGTLVETELRIGEALPDHYRAFLSCANGWKRVYQSVDLFGCQHLCQSSLHELGQTRLSLLSDDTLKKGGVTRQDVLPIAVAHEDCDLFLMTRATASSPGRVLWFAEELIDAFGSFDELFLTVIALNRQELQDLTRKA